MNLQTQGSRYADAKIERYLWVISDENDAYRRHRNVIGTS